MELLFDRGTIVIDGGTDPSPGPRPAEYFLWDSRVCQWRAPAYRLADFRSRLESRGIPCAYHSARPPEFIPAATSKEKLPVLRPYQEEALQAWTAAGGRGLVALPTGSGKTRLAIRAVLALGLPSLILVPTRHLLHQWRESIIAFYPHPVGALGDGEHDVQPITVTTYESARRHLDVIGDHFDLLVVDEAHHLGSPEVSEAAVMCTAGYRLGLSATFPERGSWQEQAADLLGPTCFSIPLASLAGTYLSPFELKVIPLRLTAQEQSEYEFHRARLAAQVRPFFQASPDADWQAFVRAAARSPAGREALESMRQARGILSLSRAKLLALDHLLDLHRAERKIVFTADNRAAYDVSRRTLSPAITCDISREERKAILQGFREGIWRTLISSKVLNEGLDVPEASVAVIVGGSTSPLEHAQRIGRILRPASGKRAVVYELVLAGTGEWRDSERRGRSNALRQAPPL